MGINTGKIMCGIVGEIKPHFQIIGTQVDKARDICKVTESGGIKISTSSFKKVVNKLNNFQFHESQAKLSGQEEIVYEVNKRSDLKKRLAANRMFRTSASSTVETGTVPSFGTKSDPRKNKDDNVVGEKDSDDDEHEHSLDSQADHLNESLESLAVDSVARSER